MKKTLVTSLFTILACASLSLALTNCENFLKGSSVKDDLEKKIYIANHDCPVATIEEPPFVDGGVEKNRAIVISFTMAMAPETFTGNYSIKDSEGNSLLEYYMTPQWSNDNTRVTIYADELNLIPIPAGQKMDIYFTLSKGCETKDGLPIETAINYKFRINSDKDEIPPVMDSDFSIKRAEKNFTKSDGTNLKLCEAVTLTPVTLADDNLDAASEQIICTNNHINSVLELYVQGSDFGGGAVKANITYSRIYDIDGNAKIENPVEKVYKENLTQSDAAGNMSQTFTIDLNGYDGIYKLVIRTEDADGNLSEESQVYYVLRDTQMSKSNSALIWFESPMFRVGGTDPATNDWVIDGERNYPAPYDSKVPTPQNVDEVRKRVQFQYLEDDTFFVSPLAGKKHYTDKRNSFKYLFSWGTSLENLTSPVEAASIIAENNLHYYGYDDYSKYPDLSDCTEEPQWVPVDPNETVDVWERINDYYNTEDGYPGLQKKVQITVPKAYTYESWLKSFLYKTYYTDEAVDDVRAYEKITYNLPQAYMDYVESHKKSNVFLQAIIIDSVGNTNTITTLSPGQVDYYGYSVGAPQAGKKRITINYSDLTSDITNLVNIPDKDCQINYRIFYAKEEEENTALIRNTAAKFNEDPWSGLTDLPWFDVPESETSKYVVYIQPNYTTHSTFTGEWTGQTFGPYLKIEVDPSKTSSAPEAPEIEAPVCDSSVKNSGLLKITLKVNNPAEGVDYVPLYSVDEKGTWQYPEYEYKKEGAKGVITFTMKNPLSAPLKQGDPGNGDPNTKHWKDKDDQGNYIFRENFFDSLERIKEYKAANNGVYENDIYFKVQAVNSSDITVPQDSDAKKVTLRSDRDDNIPPYQNSSIETHHSELTADGKYYKFGDVIREDEANLNKEFTYYYTTYNESWGDRLDVLTEEEIKALPGKGVSYIDSWCEMKYHWNLDWDGVNKPGENEKMLFIWNSPLIPIDSLDDGNYMFFGEFSDRYGNSCLITLGKAHVGTIEKKPEFSVHYGNLFVDNPVMEEDIPEHVTKWIEDRDPDSWNESTNEKEREINYAKWNYTLKKDDTFTVSMNPGSGHSSDNLYVNFQWLDIDNGTWWEAWFKNNENDANDTSLFPLENGTRTFTDIRNKSYNTGNFCRITVQSYKNDNSSIYDPVTNETLSVPMYYYFPDNYPEGNWDYDNHIAVENPAIIKRHFEEINLRSSFSPSDATVMANEKFIVNVFASPNNYGRDADKWELHGRLLKTHFFDPDNKGSEFDPLTNPFNFTTALMDLYSSDVHGSVYYVVVVHYADNTTDISDVKQVNCN